MELQRTLMWSNSSLSLSNSSLKEKLSFKEKAQGVASSSSSNEETDASSEEEAKDKREKKGDKRSYNIGSYNYDNLPHSNAFTSVPIGKPPLFQWDGLYQMEVLDEDASNLTRFENLEYCACRC
jgi:hypothetical protein